MQVVQNPFTACEKRVAAVRDAPDRQSNGRGMRISIWQGRYFLVAFFAIFRDEAKFLNAFSEKVAKLLAIVWTRDDQTTFPTTDVDPRRTDTFGNFVLRPTSPFALLSQTRHTQSSRVFGFRR